MYGLTNIYGGLDFWFFALSRMYIGIGLPLIFIPITIASYDGIPPEKTDQASALINVARNVGSSIGIALSINVFAHRQQFHQSRLVEHVVPLRGARLVAGEVVALEDGVVPEAGVVAQAARVIGVLETPLRVV